MAKAQEDVRRALRSASARVPDLFEPDTRLVVGFSGGQDSTCLLHALAHAHKRLHLLAVHVDHALRPESADDALRVAQLAQRVGVDPHVMRVDVAAYRALRGGWSRQQAARAARYQALAMAAEEHQAAAVLVAHTADDQAETLLLNLLRGTGLLGLGAMRIDETIDLRRLGPPLHEVLERRHVLRVARPLLRVARSTTQAYCSQFGLSEALVEDASNQSRAYSRNRVRLDLLPVLEQFNPAIRAVLARTADLAAEDEAALAIFVSELQTTLAHDGQWDLRLWRAQPRAVQRRLLRIGLAAVVGHLFDIADAPIEDALDLLLLRSAQPGQTYHLPYGVELCIGSNSFWLQRSGVARQRGPRNTWDVDVPRV